MLVKAPKLRPRIVVSAALIMLPIFYFFPAWLGNVALVQGDGWAANIGLRILTGQLLRQGVLPLWNPGLFGGMPLLASINTGALYPPNWIFALFSPGLAMNLVVITTFHLALCGTYLYGRAVKLSRTGALIAGTAFAFGGYLVMSLGQTSNIATAAWLPWVLLAIEKLYQRVTWRWVALGASFVALQFFAGVPQITWYTLLVTGAYFLYSVVIRKQLQPRRRFISAAIVMAVCGALLAAAQLLPLRELQLQGGRAAISYEYFSAFSFPPQQMISLVFPFFFGGATFAPYRVPYWGRDAIYVTCGYTGILSLLLGLIAIIRSRQQKLVIFWSGIALVSLLLSFGSYLPFGLDHLLYYLPVYNLFRASFRHMFEFTFAIGILAGYGATHLSQEALPKAKQGPLLATAVLAIIVSSALIGCRFLPASLNTPEILAPLSFFALSVAVIWNYVWRHSPVSAGLLMLVLLGDLMSYGHFLEWPTYKFNVTEKLADPAPVAHIKMREADLNSFRFLSYTPQPFGPNYESLNYPNNSLARGLQSANGYDVLRLQRPAAVMGDMNAEGVVQNRQAFSIVDQGFNLFNIKYLLFERQPLTVNSNGVAKGVEYEGVRFREQYLELHLSKGGKQELLPGSSTFATELVSVSTMSNSTAIPNNEPVVRVTLHTKDGQVIQRELQAGRDTSEWAYDRADVSSVIKHARAHVIESWPETHEAGGFQGHRYLARLRFERAEIERVELDYLLPEAEVVIMRASLYDSTNGLSAPLDPSFLSPERWQKIAGFGAVDLYQNLKALPRAWFVKRVVTAPRAEVLRTIREGKEPDGRPFDPAETALLEQEDLGEQANTPKTFEQTTVPAVSLVHYDSQRIELKAHTAQAGFLILSEVYYPGWEARVDSVPIPVYRANYALRGLEVPAGAHNITFIYKAPSFRQGALITGLGILLLLASGFYFRRSGHSSHSSSG
jgi:hypothetical protein